LDLFILIFRGFLELSPGGVDRFSGIQKQFPACWNVCPFHQQFHSCGGTFLSMKMTEYAEKMGISNVSEMNTSGAADVFGELQKLPAPQLLAVIIFYLFMFVLWQ